MMKLVLVDDQVLVQQGVSTLLNLSGAATVVEAFNSGVQLEAWLKNTDSDCDLILLDFHMPDQDGIETLKKIRALTEAPVVFLSTFADAALSREARRNGARGWLAKSIEIDQLVSALRSVVNGGAEFPALSDTNTADDLTAREFEVARCLVAGMTNQQIADKCHLSLGTVKNYTSNLFSKLEVANRTQAISALRARGIN
ncbi:MAG: response regulator transcription factor [Thalassolituus sp.]